MQLLDFEKARKEVLAVLAGKVNTVIAIKVVEALKKATIEAEPVRHGRWRVDEFGHFCSVCGEYSQTEDEYGFAQMHYCHNCGAKMDGDKHDLA